MLLVDLARSIARGYSQKTGGDPAAIMARIKEGFDAEWSAETGQSNAPS